MPAYPGTDAATRIELSGFLKSRRARISPPIVGLKNGNRRRTPGLRREEVADLAGVGLTWYTWLEQGRDIRVSPHDLGAIARALRLEPSEPTQSVLSSNPAPRSSSRTYSGAVLTSRRSGPSRTFVVARRAGNAFSTRSWDASIWNSRSSRSPSSRHFVFISTRRATAEPRRNCERQLSPQRRHSPL